MSHPATINAEIHHGRGVHQGRKLASSSSQIALDVVPIKELTLDLIVKCTELEIDGGADFERGNGPKRNPKMQRINYWWKWHRIYLGKSTEQNGEEMHTP